MKNLFKPLYIQKYGFNSTSFDFFTQKKEPCYNAREMIELGHIRMLYCDYDYLWDINLFDYE